MVNTPFRLSLLIFCTLSLISYGVTLVLASTISQSSLIVTQEWVLPLAILLGLVCMWAIQRITLRPAPLIDVLAQPQLLLPTRQEYWLVAGMTCLLHIFWWVVVGVDFAGDGGGYLRNYLQLDDAHPVYYTQQLYWSPFTGIIYGGLLDLGGLGAIIVLQFTLAITASLLLFTLARQWGKTAAWLCLFLWWAHGGNQMHYHLVGADGLLMWTMVVWLFLVALAIHHENRRWWFAVGLWMGVNTLVRSGNITMLVAVGATFYPLWVHRQWQKTLQNLLVAVGGVALILLPFILYNGIRYDRYQIARGSNVVWFTAAFFPDSVMSPQAGPASRQLATLVEEHLLTTDTYTGVTVEEFFTVSSHRTRDDAQALVDRYVGWETDYALLRDAGFEGIKARPTAFLRYRIKNFARQMLVKEVLINPTGNCTECEPEIIARPHESYFLTQPDGSYPSPEAIAQADAELTRFLAPIDSDHYHTEILLQVNSIWIRFGISPLLWLLFVPPALWLTKGKTRWLIIFIILAQLSVNIPTSMVVPQTRYRLPFDPFYILILVIALRHLAEKFRPLTPVESTVN